MLGRDAHGQGRRTPGGRVFLTFKDALNHKDAQNFLRAGSARANARLTDSTTSL